MVATATNRLISFLNRAGQALACYLDWHWCPRYCTTSESYADPRDGSFLPPELRVAGRVDQAAFERELITLSTQPTRDGYAGDQTLFAPPFTTTDDELGEMVSRFADAVHRVARDVQPELARSSSPTITGADR
jgi:hypothetical protein